MVHTPQSNIIKVAVAQIEPEWLDLQASVKKACLVITEAATNGASLVAFSEAHIPGYPLWILKDLMNAEKHVAYIKNSLIIDSPEMRTIQQCAANNKIVVVLGFSENDHHSLFISQAIIDIDGKIRVKRRKLKATHFERAVFGDASGNSLVNVATTSLGRRVGVLACWEHCQPLLKYHTATQREEIHCPGWPPLYPHQDQGLYSMAMEGKTFVLHLMAPLAFQGGLLMAQAYAIESQTFVLHATSVVSEKGLKKLGLDPETTTFKVGGRHSTVIGPDGRILSKPLDPNTEELVYANLDMDDILLARAFLDICGHYSRPDLLWLGCNISGRKHKLDSNEELLTAIRNEEPFELSLLHSPCAIYKGESKVLIVIIK
ncbi:hypothetical protein NW762_003158 [Fusarium torreyae]|uniref:nitrilase n=1 Tax=Fusarium torreyae TaxID=1237075 RepID=A0A9W8SA78_9HYPO|nr:hypothetical protein NW762_003158 [Fusarium torreyae]